MKPAGYSRQQGFLFVTVVIVLAVLAAIALMLSFRTSLDRSLVSQQSDSTTLDYVAQSGMAHANWQLAQNTTCASYADIPATQFGAHSYRAVFSPGSGSPVAITAIATTADGASRSISRNGVRLFQAPATITLQPGAVGTDTYIRDGANDSNNFGASTILKVNNSSAEEASLLEFDLSGIPVGSVIQSATLDLWLEGGAALSNGVLDLHTITQAWVEGDKDGQAPPAGAGATYMSYNGQNNWANPGGDYLTPPIDTLTIPTLSPGWYQWDLTSAVQNWVAGTTVNAGMILRASGGNVQKIFFTSGDGNAGDRPKLTITFACECGAGCTVSTPVSCNADYTPDEIAFEFSTAGYSQRLNRGITYFPEGQVLNGVTSPVGGAWIAVGGSGILWMVGMDGSELDGGYATGLSQLEGIAFVPAASAGDPGHLAIVRSDTLWYSDMTLPAGSSYTSHNLPFVDEAGGITYIDGGTYDRHLAIVDEGSSQVHIINESFNLVTSLATDSVLDKPEGVAHLKDTDKFLIVDPGLSAALVIDANLAVSQNYDLSPFNLANGSGAAAAIHPTSCNHVFGDRPNNRYANLNVAGAANNTVVLSTYSGATLGGLTFTDKDLAEYKLDTDTAALYLEGAAVGISQDIDALHVLANDHMVLSAINTITLGGVTAENEDLIDYDPATDTATLLFDGSALFSSGSTDLSAVHVLDNGHLLLTNEYTATLGGVSFGPNDILDYDPVSDTATLYFDGDAVGFLNWINAVHVLDSGNIVISAAGSGSLGGLGFGEGDLVEYDPALATATLFFDGAMFSAAENVRSVHVGPGSGGDSGAGTTLGLLAHWKMDDAGGLTALDSVGGHDGTLTNGPKWTAGKLGGALSLDGANDFVSVPHHDGLSLTQTMTLTAWVNPSFLGGSYQTILAKDDGGSGSNYYFGTWQQEMVFGFFSGGLFREIFTSGLSLQTNSWYHLAASFDDTSGVVRLYVDGAEVHSDTLKFSPTPVKANLTIARSPDGERWGGLLDDVRIYDRVLTTLEVADLAGAGGSGGGGSCEGTFRDEFNAESYGNNDGTLKWSTNWLEINESDGWDSGDERVDDNDSDFHLQVRDNDGGGEGVQREADLSAYAAATFGFEYRRDGFDNANDYVMAQVSSNGGSSWTELDRLGGEGTDTSYVSKSYDISAHITPNTRVRFLTSPNLGSGDELYVDNIQIAVKGCTKQ